MALIEINLEEPALLESQTRSGGSKTEKKQKTSKRGGGKGKLLGLLVLVAGVSLLALKLRGGSDEEQEAVGVEDEFEKSESGGGKGKLVGALGLLVALVGVGAARKRRK
ncbi:hypothetical protein [Halorussus halophilus]|uniref:hypothetical protein n=1 Tax=Halorussus halophilus TaxID=2650975 RepID=UPI0013016C0D|nr:hypothetical protein [Halorussus halophilus]